METPMEQARELVDDIVFGLGAGAPYVLAQDARRIVAIAAAGLALRAPMQGWVDDQQYYDADLAGLDDILAAFDAAIAQAVAESEGE